MAVNVWVCKWCGEPVAWLWSKEWGHTEIQEGRENLRFWCLVAEGDVRRVEPVDVSPIWDRDDN